MDGEVLSKIKLYSHQDVDRDELEEDYEPTEQMRIAQQLPRIVVPQLQHPPETSINS